MFLYAIFLLINLQNAVWTAGQNQTVVWNSVNTDPGTVSVYLVNFSRYPTQSILLKSNVATTSGTLTIDGSYLSVGTGYQINLVPGTNTEQILAQSNQFSIVAAAGSTTTTAAAAAAAAATTASGTTAATSANALPKSNSTLASTTSAGSRLTAGVSALLVVVGSCLL